MSMGVGILSPCRKASLGARLLTGVGCLSGTCVATGLVLDLPWGSHKERYKRPASKSCQHVP